MSGTPPYVELHAHSAYSFLDGASLPEELIARAAELGYTAIALTDHDSLAARWSSRWPPGSPRVRAIYGAEVTVEAASDGGQLRHLTLLVRDGHGWRNLCRLLTLSHAHTRDSPDRRAGEPSVPLEQVLEHADGLVCLTGCAERSVIAHGISESRPPGDCSTPSAPTRCGSSFNGHMRAVTGGATGSLSASPGASTCPRSRPGMFTRTPPCAHFCRTPSWPRATECRWTPPRPSAARTTAMSSRVRRRWPPA